MTGYWKRRKGNYSAASRSFYWIRSLAVSYTYKAHSDNYNPTLFSSPSTPILPPLLPNAPVSHSIFLCIAVAVLRLTEFSQHLPYDHGFKTHGNMGSSLGDTLLKQIIAFPQNSSVANLVQQGEIGLSYTPLDHDWLLIAQSCVGSLQVTTAAVRLWLKWLGHGQKTVLPQSFSYSPDLKAFPPSSPMITPEP